MVRLMTYNVHGCVGVDGRLDIGRIAAVIAAEEPDIVALQELDVGRARSGGIDQAHEIARRLGMTSNFNCAMRVEEEQYGDALLTRLPHRLVRIGALPTLPRSRLEMRGAVWIAVETGPSEELQVLNTHMGLVPLEQRAQVAALLGRDWIGGPEWRAPAVLLGDLNATSRYAAYRALAGQLRDVQRPADGRRGHRATLKTFPSRRPLLRIDHMFLTLGIEVERVRVAREPLARVASDHLPLVADLRPTGTAS